MRTGLLAVALIVAGCVTTETAVPTESIVAASDRFEAAFNAGDAAGLAALYTSDAIVMPPNMERITGRDRIRALWQNFFDAGVTSIDLHTDELRFAGIYATEVGAFTLGAPDGKGGKLEVEGKYIVVWRKEHDGSWRLHRDIWNNDPAG